jgi:hypothetical protein
MPRLPESLELAVGTTSLDTDGSANINVIASNGAIVVVGDGAQLNANSGPVSQGGIVALDTVGSQLSTGRGVSTASSPVDEEPAGASTPSEPDDEQSLD